MYAWYSFGISFNQIVRSFVDINIIYKMLIRFILLAVSQFDLHHFRSYKIYVELGCQ